MFLLNPDIDPACVSAATGRPLQLPHPPVDTPLALPNSVFRHPWASCDLLRLIPAGCSPAGTVAASSGPSGYRIFGHTATVGVARCGRGQRQVSGTVDRHLRRRFRLHPPARLIEATSGRRLSLRSRSSNVVQRPRNRFRSRRHRCCRRHSATTTPIERGERGLEEGRGA